MLLSPAFFSRPELYCLGIRIISMSIAESWNSKTVERIRKSSATCNYEKGVVNIELWEE
jgi:hypothetical protein